MFGSRGLLSGFDQHEAFEAIYKDATVEPQDLYTRETQLLVLGSIYQGCMLSTYF